MELKEYIEILERLLKIGNRLAENEQVMGQDKLSCKFESEDGKDEKTPAYPYSDKIWHSSEDNPDSDRNILVTFQNEDCKFLEPIIAYYCEERDDYFPILSLNSYPIQVDFWCELPRKE